MDKSSLKKTVNDLSAQISKNLKIDKISVDTGKVNSSVGGALKNVKDFANNTTKNILSSSLIDAVKSYGKTIVSSGRNKIMPFLFVCHWEA